MQYFQYKKAMENFMCDIVFSFKKYDTQFFFMKFSNVFTIAR